MNKTAKHKRYLKRSTFNKPGSQTSQGSISLNQLASILGEDIEPYPAEILKSNRTNYSYLPKF